MTPRPRVTERDSAVTVSEMLDLIANLPAPEGEGDATLRGSQLASVPRSAPSEGGGSRFTYNPASRTASEGFHPGGVGQLIEGDGPFVPRGS